jgi:hypothetical protein
MCAVAPDFHMPTRLVAKNIMFAPTRIAKILAMKKRLFYRHFCDVMNFVRELVRSAKTFAASICPR